MSGKKIHGLFLIKIILLQVIIYCDLHGHSRKPNVFMYGCTADPKMASMSNFVEERLFPWMMSQKVKDRSAGRACQSTATGRFYGRMNAYTLFEIMGTFNIVVIFF